MLKNSYICKKYKYYLHIKTTKNGNNKKNICNRWKASN